MISDNLKATGELNIILRDSQGNIKVNVQVPNLVVTVGKTAIASRLVGASTAIMSHMAIGSGATAPAASQTTLVTEATRSALTSATNTGNEVNYSAIFGSGTSIAVTEAGLFNAASGGIMLSRTTFPVVNKDTADTLTVNWKITIN